MVSVTESVSTARNAQNLPILYTLVNLPVASIQAQPRWIPALLFAHAASHIASHGRRRRWELARVVVSEWATSGNRLIEVTYLCHGNRTVLTCYVSWVLQFALTKSYSHFFWCYLTDNDELSEVFPSPVVNTQEQNLEQSRRDRSAQGCCVFNSTRQSTSGEKHVLP